jgi:hypothetical protein
MTYYGGSLRGPREAIEDKMSSMKQVSKYESELATLHQSQYREFREVRHSLAREQRASLFHIL